MCCQEVQGSEVRGQGWRREPGLGEVGFGFSGTPAGKGWGRRRWDVLLEGGWGAGLELWARAQERCSSRAGAELGSSRPLRWMVCASLVRARKQETGPESGGEVPAGGWRVRLHALCSVLRASGRVRVGAGVWCLILRRSSIRWKHRRCRESCLPCV